MPESAFLQERRKRKEQMLLQARERMLQSLGNTLMTRNAHDNLMSACSSLYVDWGNAFSQEHAEDITRLLKSIGAEVDVKHAASISFGDFYPTEYTISIGNIQGSGPTFDMALVDFIQKQIKQSQDLLLDLRVYISHDKRAFPEIDAPADEKQFREKLLKRVAKILGEEE